MTQAKHRVLIVDDDPIVLESLADLVAGLGHTPVTAQSAEEGLAAIEDAGARRPNPFAVVVTDIVMPGMDGLDLLKRLATMESSAVPLVVTGYGTIETAVTAVRLGAIDYLTKPVVEEELRLAVEKAVRQHVLLAENANLKRQLDRRDGLDNIVGSDPRMRRVYEVIEAVAPTRTTVLMTGESGTGKSLVARAIHRRSPRANGPFVEISCGSIPETLLESELFGHVKGAFTGAHADKIGRFLAADGGTLFLDEINSASPAMQLKLLRALQERRFEPVGSTETVDVDVRIVLASNEPLERLVAAGEFRQDLYYRINVVMIELPPLRERVSDIAPLANHFLARFAKEAGRGIVGFSDDALAALKAYSFPGNVRELENVVERAVVLARGQTIEERDLPPQVVENNPTLRPRSFGGESAPEVEWRSLPLAEALKEPERQIILAALEANEWNRQQTADALGINRTTLYKKMKDFGLGDYAKSA